ncbi:hypothetical protein NOI24_03600 [Neorhizobium galegae]|uniref:hypothetical protein n=1 Tax=Neorhizobium galegae TaxID=399 RepID=UPI002107901A|nr:hypothetical protein [Neorhizobium galegae]MCQ1770370.1 hypothetical protein [Neorhizobium galegae]MCQ1799691.1 hypothetical protein [Neorhizobium galegae]
METKKTLVRGLAIDVIVVETMQSDSLGHLFYVAMIYVRHRRTGAQHLVQRTRIPGTGQALARDVQRRGIRALEAFRPVA